MHATKFDGARWLPTEVGKGNFVKTVKYHQVNGHRVDWIRVNCSAT